MYKYMRIYVYTCSYTDIHTLVHILYTCLHLWINYISIFIYIYIYIIYTKLMLHKEWYSIYKRKSIIFSYITFAALAVL